MLRRHRLLSVILLLVVALGIYQVLRFGTMPLIGYIELLSDFIVAMITLSALLAVERRKKTFETVYYFLTIGFSALFISLWGTTLGHLFLRQTTLALLTVDFFQIIGFVFISLGIMKWVRYNESMQEELKMLATTDELTGMLNRRAFLQGANIFYENNRRYGRGLYAVLIDIDHFKNINDTYGHPFGDEVLKEFGERLIKGIRKSDIAARWGGEEFVLLLQEVKEDDSVAIAEKIRGDIEKLEIYFGDKKARLTASFGIAGLRDGDADMEELIGRADEALYAAKHAGRNCVKTNF